MAERDRNQSDEQIADVNEDAVTAVDAEEDDEFDDDDDEFDADDDEEGEDA